MPGGSVSVLVISLREHLPISEECLGRITAVSPRIKLQDVSDLVAAERRGDFSSKEQLDALLAEAEVIYGSAPPRDLIARAPKLRWVHTMLAGADYFLANIAQSPVVLTKTRGIHGQVGEFVFGLIMMFAKQAQLCFRLQQEKRWQKFSSVSLRSKTVGIVGLGSIGKEVAQLAKAFGMRVVATRGSAKRVTRARYVDAVLPREQLPALLPESDFVVLTLPLTSETINLIGERELRTMKPTAYLINVSRGKIVDEDALIRALSENWIAGAGLDTFASEPLPTDSRLWDLPNVIVTPHIAGRVPNVDVMATELFCENLRRYLNGERLLNVVDKTKGY